MTAVDDIFAGLIEERGGVEAFNSAQLALAGELSQLMQGNSPALSPAERVQRASTIVKLSALLPPAIVKPQVTEYTLDGRESLQDLTNAYAQMVRGEASFVFTEEYEEALVAARRAEADSDIILFLRDRLTASDFDRWLTMTQAANAAAAAPVEPLPLPPYPSPAPAIARPATSYEAHEVEVLPPGKASRETYPPPPEIDASGADEPAVDPRLRAGFSYFRLSAEARAKIERGEA